MIDAVVHLVAPIFLIIALGFVTAYSKILKEGMGDTLGNFCVSILVPLLIFRTLSQANLGAVFPAPLWGAYFGGLLSVYLLGAIIVRYLFKREARAAVIGGITASYGNTGLVGIALITSLYGEDGLVPLSLIIALHLPIVVFLSTILMERAVVMDGYGAPPPLGQAFKGAFLSLLKNPIIIGIIAGLLWNFSGLAMPALVETALVSLAKSASPVALFAVGMTLLDYGIRGTLAIGSVLSLLKIIIMPLLVFLLVSQVFVLPPLWVSVATIAAACPTGVNAYLMASQFGTGHAMSANAITLTTFASVVSASGWLYLLDVMGY
ncbi:AEC family transporter [Flexibacterium corallicola]|uniref:AEC family transporter n=1 Tax=Flexibacterium corallicola TaxID=3037259 RepID=UPI00286F1C21|nr:AEC family transporter [Pseudovibrio sp. M1P-2-3]